MPEKSLPKPEPAKGVYVLPLDEIKQAIEKVRFGSVQLIIQDGRIVQIDTIEKKRLA